MGGKQGARSTSTATVTGRTVDMVVLGDDLASIVDELDNL